MKETKISIIFVILYFFKDNEEIKKMIEKEYKIMESFDHPLIIKPIELIYDEEKLTYIIIEEFFEGKSLFNLMKNKNVSLNLSNFTKLL